MTLWGPTHLMLIGGAGLSLVGQAVLLGEGLRARARTARAERPAPALQLRPEHVTAVRRIGLMGGLLIGLSTFQAEFDFGVPQYRLVFQPMLIALAAGFALVAARLWIGRGGALGAALFFLALRGGVSLLVGPVFGQTTPSLPLYLGEALCVEAARARARSAARWRSAPPAASLIGTVGLASEWGWSQVAMRLPWSADLLPEAVVFAVAAGVAGGVAGALLALGPARRAAAARGRAHRRSSLATARGRPCSSPPACTTDVPAGRARDVALDPRARRRRRDRQRDRARLAALARRRPRLGDRHGLAGRRPARRPAARGRAGRLPHQPADPGARRVEVARARARGQRGARRARLHARRPGDPGSRRCRPRRTSRRPLQRDTEVLQRERDFDVPAWLWGGATALVLALYLSLLAALSWGVGRIGRTPRTVPYPRHAARAAREAAARPGHSAGRGRFVARG